MAGDGKIRVPHKRCTQTLMSRNGYNRLFDFVFDPYFYEREGIINAPNYSKTKLFKHITELRESGEPTDYKTIPFKELKQ
jgi:hypothetical protein